jgi:hypothetical protein
VKELHAGIGGGHLGEQKTSLKVKDRFYWPGWTTDVEIMCMECVVCATKKCPSKQSKALFHKLFGNSFCFVITERISLCPL